MKVFKAETWYKDGREGSFAEEVSLRSFMEALETYLRRWDESGLKSITITVTG